MKRRRLHWFWRGAIATIVAFCYEIALVGTLAETGWTLDEIEQWLVRVFAMPDDVAFVLAYSSITLLPILLALGVYGGLTLWLSPSDDGETHCRKCDYILRGISEPRCPECGERI